MNRPFSYYMVKTVRISGWFLLPIVLSYLVSGFALCGRYGFDKVISDAKAADIHTTFIWALIGLLAMHVVPATYLAFRRWGWIKRRKKA